MKKQPNTKEAPAVSAPREGSTRPARSTFEQYNGPQSHRHPRSNPVWYNPRKVAQILAFFANKEGGDLAVLKAVKLAYLADRKHMEDYAHPLFQDKIVSMKHGPVHSITYNFINGTQEEEEGWNGWKDFIRRSDNLHLAATDQFTRDDLDELSDAEIDTMEATWEKFGHMTRWQIRDWTHKHCPEWEDPGYSSTPIPRERILEHLGYKNANEIAEDIRDERRAKEFWASL